LPSKSEKDAVGTFSFDDIGDIFRGDREIVDFIGKDVCGLNSGNVGIDKDRLDARLLQRLERLGS